MKHLPRFFYFLHIIFISLSFSNCSKDEDKFMDSIYIQSNINQIKIGEEIQLNYNINSEFPDQYNVSWKSTANNIASVSSNGIVKGIDEGETKIIITAQNTSVILSDTLSVSVSAINVKSVNITLENITIEEGCKQNIEYEILPNNATNKILQWNSSNSSIAEIKSGVILTKTPGKCKIYATSNNGIKDSLFVEVTPAPILEVNVTEAGSLRNEIGGKENLGLIKRLKINGSLNAYDIEDIRNMSSLYFLDISEISLVPGGVYKGNCTVTPNTIGDWMFYNLKIKQIILPKTVTAIGFHAFDGCSNLEKCILPENLKSIGYASFMDCSSIEEISLPQTLSSIGYHSFTNCRSLKSIDIPNSVTFIDTNAFLNCEDLETVVFGSRLKKMNQWIFTECKKISHIYMNTIPDENSSFSNNIFEETLYNKTTLHIPKGSLEKFSHTPFENFKNIVEM